MVSHLALSPHRRAGQYLKLLAGKKLRDLRCKLCHQQFLSQPDFWRHQAREHFYDDLALTILEKNSGQSGHWRCPASNCLNQHDGLARAVDHLGLDHGKAAELYKTFLVSSQTLSCQLCGTATTSPAQLKLHLATQHFSQQLMSENYVAVRDCSYQYQCLLCEAEIKDGAAMLTHLGMVHNLTEELYRRAMSVGFQCSLCPDWRSSRKAEFLHHVTNIHCRHLATDRTWVRDPTGAPVYRCDLCSRYFSTESLYLSHVGEEGPCHQSLPLYFAAVDQRHGLNTPLLTAAQALARLDITDYALSGRKFFRSSLGQLLVNPGNYVDPFSCDISLRLDFNTISIILQQPVYPASLKSRQRFKKGPFSCIFCDILNKELVESDFVAYQIHLAEHYSEQLQSFFGIEGSEQYLCSLCPTEERFSNLQCLVGHLATHHETIIGLYEATAPLPAQLKNCDKNTVNLPPSHFLLSSIFPWFPPGLPAIRNLTSAQSEPELLDKTEKPGQVCVPSQCLECLEEFPGVPELMDHMEQMEHINLHWVAETNRDGRFVIFSF